VNRSRLGRRGTLILALALTAIAVAPGEAPAASPAPAWNPRVIPMPTNFAPGAQGNVNTGPRFNILATNVGGATASGPIVLTDTLPVGMKPTDASAECSIAGQTVTCTFPGPVFANGTIRDTGFGVEVDDLAEGTVLTNEATIESSGAAPVSTSEAITISSDPAPFGLLDGPAGLSALLTEADGSAATVAGSHPDQLSVDLGVNTKPGAHGEQSTTVIASGGGVRDVVTNLPPGLIVNPAATSARCTEAQLEDKFYVRPDRGCPDASAIGRAGTMLSFAGFPFTTNDAVYSMVPPPGSAASLGFQVFGTSIFVHVLGGLRPGDYTISATTPDIPNLFNHILYEAELHLWSDPAGPAHDLVRGHCGSNYGGFPDGSECPVPQVDTAALTMPTSCGPTPTFEAEIDSWEEPGKFLTRTVPFTDLEGNPVAGVSGCNAVPFKPSLSAQPTTNLADSPTGLDVDLEVPQSESLSATATAHLKEATVTLPEGLVVNPSSANGLAGCSPAEIGIDAQSGVADGNRAQCPDASKIGSVEVDSPLLAEYDSENKVKRDGEGHVIAEPIEGAVYLATPHDNPFGSLLAIYLAVENPDRGIVVKLAGEVSPDPQTGRLTTTFADNPQLPFSAFKLHFFGGARAALKTPLSCGTKTTTSLLTPWSTPEGADATPSDSFQTTGEPGGGSCPGAEAQAANHPAFNAGTLAPQAGAYSPLVLKLSREDGSAPISAIDTTLPPGLTGKLAGISYCPDSALASAAAKSGNAERQSPSCPASSRVGTVTVGAGAGPTPYYTQGTAYLAGPYKGAPLSVGIVTPATAGPYDLGTVVVRAALYVDPETARIHAVSDPIPQILQGIPLDVRSIALQMDRPDFTLNPTSCDSMALTGNATSPFGSSAALSSPFQVGGCSALPFKPKLAISLKGGTKRGDNPALRAVLTAKPGEANIKKAIVALPHSEFLDQSHIRTICTRVQFAADQCPARSIYGKATAITPLLDQPLSGPVYLRSSSHQLPDLVADLNGQIHVVLVGRVDSIHGGIRNSFEAVPDAPVSRFVLEMQGGKKGLLDNSRNLCNSVNRASVEMDGQNGKTYDSTPVLKVKCPKHKSGRHQRHGS
jgi:uncharacterized repeat protein (TIGR01451 family)